MSGLTEFLAGLSAAAVVGLAANLISDRVGQFLSTREESRKLARELETEALHSNDISMLGNYLYDNIGATRISNYVHDDAVREKVNRALDGVLKFLGPEEVGITPQEVAEAEAATPSAESRERRYSGQPADVEMRKALQEIQYGEPWNGLARMRRHIETQLRQLAPDTMTNASISAGRLLDLMTRQEFIPPGPAKQLRYAIRVANAGIHGENVDPSQAEEAWDMARAALSALDIPRSTGNDAD